MLLVAGAVLASAAPAITHADACMAARVDVADWPIVRSPRVPGFTLRLPRAYVRTPDATSTASAAATWTIDGQRARVTLVHASRSAPPPSDPLATNTGTRCDERIGSATATIVTYSSAATTTTYVVHARIRWPDGEEIVVHAESTDRPRVDELIAAVRSVRRAGA